VGHGRDGEVVRAGVMLTNWGPIYKISYDLSTYDSDVQRANISLRNIVSEFTNTISDDLTTLQVNLPSSDV